MWDIVHGFDLNYFSFFTLNEHIVFALQALPYAMLVCAISLPRGCGCFSLKHMKAQIAFKPNNPNL